MVVWNLVSDYGENCLMHFLNVIATANRSFSDFWKSYNCIPASTHQKVGKETDKTAHIERLNNTIRQRFSRFVRKTLSFSKKEYMINLHFKLWAFQYNIKLM